MTVYRLAVAVRSSDGKITIQDIAKEGCEPVLPHSTYFARLAISAEVHSEIDKIGRSTPA